MADMKKQARMMPDQGLKDPVRPFNETFSAALVLKEAFFPETLTDDERDQLRKRDEQKPDWKPARIYKPDRDEVVLIRGWGEGRKHYVYSLGIYEVDTASAVWKCDLGNRLWFDPYEWTSLPQPKAVA